MAVRGHIWILHLTAGDCRLWLCCRLLASLLIVARDRHKKDLIQVQVSVYTESVAREMEDHCTKLKRWPASVQDTTTAASECWQCGLVEDRGTTGHWDGEEDTEAAPLSPHPHPALVARRSQGGDLSSILQIQGSYNWCLEYHSSLLTPSMGRSWKRWWRDDTDLAYFCQINK